MLYHSTIDCTRPPLLFSRFTCPKGQGRMSEWACYAPQPRTSIVSAGIWTTWKGTRSEGNLLNDYPSGNADVRPMAHPSEPLSYGGNTQAAAPHHEDLSRTNMTWI